MYSNETDLPMSRKPSSKFVLVISCCAIRLTDLTIGLPGCMLVARTMPNRTFSIDVRTKYTSVLSAMEPFSLTFKVAVPVKKQTKMV